jgi:hypothetical protein
LPGVVPARAKEGPRAFYCGEIAEYGMPSGLAAGGCSSTIIEVNRAARETGARGENP